MRVFYALKSEVPAGYHTRSVMKGSRVVPMMTLVKASMNPVSDMCLPPWTRPAARHSQDADLRNRRSLFQGSESILEPVVAIVTTAPAPLLGRGVALEEPSISDKMTRRPGG
ncbi:hypothetical protein GCM10009434_09260 [Brevundimonas olei]